MTGFSSVLSPCNREPMVGGNRNKDKGELPPRAFFANNGVAKDGRTVIRLSGRAYSSMRVVPRVRQPRPFYKGFGCLFYFNKIGG